MEPTDPARTGRPDDKLAMTKADSALPSRRLDRQRLQRALDDAGDGIVVLLQHHHVTVAVNVAVGEGDEGVGDAGLGEIRSGAVIVGGVVGRLRRNDQDRDVFQVRQLASRLCASVIGGAAATIATKRRGS
jgi:hypothetical protein